MAKKKTIYDDVNLDFSVSKAPTAGGAYKTAPRGPQTSLMSPWQRANYDDAKYAAASAAFSALPTAEQMRLGNLHYSPGGAFNPRDLSPEALASLGITDSNATNQEAWTKGFSQAQGFEPAGIQALRDAITGIQGSSPFSDKSAQEDQQQGTATSSKPRTYGSSKLQRKLDKLFGAADTDSKDAAGLWKEGKRQQKIGSEVATGIAGYEQGLTKTAKKAAKAINKAAKRGIGISREAQKGATKEIEKTADVGEAIVKGGVKPASKAVERGIERGQGVISGAWSGAKQQAKDARQEAEQLAADRFKRDYQMLNQTYGAGSQQLQTLRAAQEGLVPSVAEQQMAAGIESAQRAQMSAAMSGGFNPAAQYKAAQASGSLQQAAVRDAAQLRAEEIARAREQTTGAIGQQAGIAQQAGALTGAQLGYKTAQQGLATDLGQLGVTAGQAAGGIGIEGGQAIGGITTQAGSAYSDIGRQAGQAAGSLGLEAGRNIADIGLTGAETGANVQTQAAQTGAGIATSAATTKQGFEGLGAQYNLGAANTGIQQQQRDLAGRELAATSEIAAAKLHEEELRRQAEAQQAAADRNLERQRIIEARKTGKAQRASLYSSTGSQILHGIGEIIPG